MHYSQNDMDNNQQISRPPILSVIVFGKQCKCSHIYTTDGSRFRENRLFACRGLTSPNP